MSLGFDQNATGVSPERLPPPGAHPDPSLALAGRYNEGIVAPPPLEALPALRTPQVILPTADERARAQRTALLVLVVLAVGLLSAVACAALSALGG
jgi:hypothetical protein